MMLAFALSAVPNEAAGEAVSGTVRTRDNVSIAYEHYKKGFDSVIIICPGFYNSKTNRWMRKTVELVSSRYDVIIFDLRGHGSSGGKFTWSAKEDMDVNAVADYAASGGYKHIGIVAFSLGAAAAVNAAVTRDDIDSMVLISCPSKFEMIDYQFWRPEMLSDLTDNIACGWEGKGARTANIFIPKARPVDTISRIKNTAVLFIHGSRDWVVKDRHSKRLYDAAAAYKEIEIIEGGLHAERLIQFHPDRMQALILDWFSRTLK
jgi:pimeloyl-ACP methyl ester carboxylesterase